MSMTNSSRHGRNSEMNVTPLIDVLLVLLIIFMVVLPQHKFGEEADIPQASQPAPPQPQPETIVLQIHDNGEGKLPDLKINRERVSWEQLEPRLRAIFDSRAEKVAFVKGDPELDFEQVAEVLDATHHAGAQRIGLLGAKP